MFPQTDQFHSLLSLWILCTDWCTTAMLIYIHPHQRLEIKYKKRLKVSYNIPTLYLLPFQSKINLCWNCVYVCVCVRVKEGGWGMQKKSGYLHFQSIKKRYKILNSYIFYSFLVGSFCSFLLSWMYNKMTL